MGDHHKLPVSEGSLQGRQRGTLHHCSERIRSKNECKLKDRKFRLDIRKKPFTVRVVTLGELPRKVLDTQTLVVFKSHIE